jgi:DNA-binding beta-propeller fold protein YncE
MNTRFTPSRVVRLAALPLAALLLLAGCATKPKAPKEAVFFPPAPDQPRIQYLTSFSSEAGYAGKGGFKDFVTGGSTLHRPIWKPYGVTLRPGRLYVCDTQPKNVGTLDLAKKQLRYLRPTGQEALKMPINVAVDSDGTKYVADTGWAQVRVYGPDGKFRGPFAPEHLGKPCGLVLAGDRLYVGDLSNRCVRVFNKATREVLLTLPQAGAPEAAQVRGPTNLAVDDQGRIYVSDTMDFTVKIFAPDGQHLRTVGDLGTRPGAFALPKGIGVDRAGRFYVVDGATGVIQLFDQAGQLLMYFAGPDSPGGSACYLPAGLAVDYDNLQYFQSFVAPGRQIEYLIFVANQLGDRKISVYGFLKQ